MTQPDGAAGNLAPSPAVDPYAAVTRKIATDRCVILDGATGSELFEVEGQRPELDDHMWGVGALMEAPDQVQHIHHRYVEAACDVVSTATWGLPTALRQDHTPLWNSGQPVHWMDSARRAVRIARSASAGSDSEVAVAFSINGDVDMYADRTLTKSPITPADQAEAYFLLVSQRLSKTTGQVVTVDGGLHEAFLR